MFDLIIRGARVVDGTGKPSTVRNVAITSGRIVDVGRLGLAAARRVIDGTHKWLLPGFIDPHSHSDFALLANPGAVSHVRQGITTEVVGNCGFSAFPLSSANRNLLIDPPGVEGGTGNARDHFQRLSEVGCAVNAATLWDMARSARRLSDGTNVRQRRASLPRMCALVHDAMSRWNLVRTRLRS